MLKKVPAAYIATVLLGTTPALAVDAPDHAASFESASATTTTSHHHVLAQAQSTDSGHESMGGMKPGMSHEKMMEKSADEKATSGHVMAQGKVNSVNESERTVNLSHEPISALGWPSMTMDMKVSDGMDLSKVPVGKPIDFTLNRGSDGIYVVDTITAQ